MVEGKVLVRISQENMDRLIKIKGRFEFETGKTHTRDDALKEVLDFYEKEHR